MFYEFMARCHRPVWCVVISALIIFGAFLAGMAHAAEQQQLVIRVVGTTNPSEACYSGALPRKVFFLSDYNTCPALNNNFYNCRVFMVAGSCFMLVLYNKNEEIVQVDIIDKGRHETVRVYTP